MEFKLYYLTFAHRNLELIKLNPNLLISVYFSPVKKWNIIQDRLIFYI